VEMGVIWVVLGGIDTDGSFLRLVDCRCLIESDGRWGRALHNWMVQAHIPLIGLELCDHMLARIDLHG
jgi:hypothetical protein